MLLALLAAGEDVAIIARQLSSAERLALQKDLIHAPAWIADFLHPITAASS